MNVESLLNDRGMSFSVLPHRTEYTASRTAQSLHVPGAHFAKTVVLEADERRVLAVIPANHSVNMDLVRQEMGVAEVHLLDEREFPQLFPDCELGAVPPFGSEYGMETIVDDTLAADEQIVFDGNTHDSAIQMRFRDYANIEHPHVAHITN